MEDLSMLSAAAAALACSVATLVVKRRRDWRKVVGILKDLEDSCEMPLGKLREIVDLITVEMRDGLVSDRGPNLKIWLTLADELPNGTERGTYYGLHLGASYFKINRVYLNGKRSSLEVQDFEQHSIPTSLLNNTSEVFFDFLATSMQTFIEKEGYLSLPVRRKLAFTFSFPVKLSSFFPEVLIRWTEEFGITEMVGKDIAQCLQIAMYMRGLDIEVVALVDDTVAAVSCGYYHDPDTTAAVIFGTGSTDACYLERTHPIIKSRYPGITSERMVVNMEWGSFRTSHLPPTLYDVELGFEEMAFDGLQPYDMAFAMMIRGMYLADLVRRVIHRMSDESDIFGPASSILVTPLVLRTNSLLAMLEDDTPELQEVARVLNDLGVAEVSLEVRKLVVKICHVVTRRAARLSATGIAAILMKIGRDGSGGRRGSDMRVMRRTVVFVEGDLYLNFKSFREYMHKGLRDILGERVAQHVVVKAMDDATIIGSALFGASRHRLRTTPFTSTV